MTSRGISTALRLLTDGKFRDVYASMMEIQFAVGQPHILLG